MPIPFNSTELSRSSRRACRAARHTMPPAPAEAQIEKPSILQPHNLKAKRCAISVLLPDDKYQRGEEIGDRAENS